MAKTEEHTQNKEEIPGCKCWQGSRATGTLIHSFLKNEKYNSCFGSWAFSFSFFKHTLNYVTQQYPF